MTRLKRAIDGLKRFFHAIDADFSDAEKGVGIKIVEAMAENENVERSVDQDAIASPVSETFRVVPDSERRRAEFCYAPDGGEENQPIINSIEIIEVCEGLDLVKLKARTWNSADKRYDETTTIMSEYGAQYEFDVFDMQPSREYELAEQAAIDEMAQADFDDWYREQQNEWEPVAQADNKFVSYIISDNQYNSIDNTYACIWIEAINGNGQVKIIESVHHSYTDAESLTESVVTLEEALDKIRSYKREAVDMEHAKLRGEDELDIVSQLDPIEDLSIAWDNIPVQDQKFASFTEGIEDGSQIRELAIVARYQNQVKVEQRTKYREPGEMFTTHAILSTESAEALFRAYAARQAIDKAVEPGVKPTSHRM